MHCCSCPKSCRALCSHLCTRDHRTSPSPVTVLSQFILGLRYVDSAMKSYWFNQKLRTGETAKHADTPLWWSCFCWAKPIFKGSSLLQWMITLLLQWGVCVSDYRAWEQALIVISSITIRWQTQNLAWWSDMSWTNKGTKFSQKLGEPKGGLCPTPWTSLCRKLWAQPLSFRSASQILCHCDCKLDTFGIKQGKEDASRQEL